MQMLQKNNSEPSHTRSSPNNLLTRIDQLRAESFCSAFVIEPGQPIFCVPQDETERMIPEKRIAIAIKRAIDFMIVIYLFFLLRNSGRKLKTISLCFGFKCNG